MVKDNKDLKITDKKFVVPTTPKTETKIVLEQQDLYPDLGYEDIGSSKGYGPTDKGKKKSSNGKTEVNGQHLINTFNNKWGSDDFNLDTDGSAIKEDGVNAFNFTSSFGTRAGAGGAIAEAGASGSIFRYDDGVGDLRIGGGSIGGEIGGGSGGVTARYTAQLDAVNMQSHGVQARIGLDGGSGFTAGPGGVEVKAVGFGVSVGKKTGISTPIGELSVDFEETCNQQ